MAFRWATQMSGKNLREKFFHFFASLLERNWGGGGVLEGLGCVRFMSVVHGIRKSLQQYAHLLKFPEF